MLSPNEKITTKKIILGLLLFLIFLTFIILKVKAISETNQNTMREIAQYHLIKQKIELIKKLRIHYD